MDLGGVILTPSIHPEIPEDGTYYINKPSQNVEAPLPVSPTFSGQIPCADNSCGGEKGISTKLPIFRTDQ